MKCRRFTHGHNKRSQKHELRDNDDDDGEQRTDPGAVDALVAAFSTVWLRAESESFAAFASESSENDENMLERQGPPFL